jgi:hypothetical protein
MAVFSGGRWIRGELTGAGEDFWVCRPGKEGEAVPSADHAEKETDEYAPAKVDRKRQPSRELENLGLSFWFHDSETDGDDIKAVFKAQLQDAERILTTQQRADVIAEARSIFVWCKELVNELDDEQMSATRASREGRWRILAWLPVVMAAGVGLLWFSRLVVGRFVLAMAYREV